MIKCEMCKSNTMICYSIFVIKQKCIRVSALEFPS